MERIGLIAGIEDVPDFLGDITKMNKAVDSFGDAGAKAGSAFDKGFSEVITGALRHVGEMTVDALAKAGRAVADFVGDSIGLAGDFDQGMREFQVAAGKDIDTSGLERFHDLFIQLGKDLPVSTSDVQQAAIEMVKGGIDPAILAAGALKQNIEFAGAAMKGDLVGAAEISSKIVGGWADVNATAADKADLLAHATDLLTKAANASQVDVKELSKGLFNVQGTAKAAGIGLDDVTTVLAELAGDFASSAEAGTSLKNFIVRLQPTTKPAIAAMQGLGLWTEKSGSAFYDAQGKFVGFQKASQLLQNSLKGLTDAQRVSVMQTIFGNDAMGVASGLAERGAAGYDTMTASLANAMGVTEAARIQQEAFNVKIDNAKGSFEALQLTIGGALLPTLGDLLDNYITPSINALTDFAGKILGASDPALALASALHGWSEPLGSIAFYLVELSRNGEGVNAWLAETPPMFQGLVGAVQDAIPVVEKIGAFLSDNLEPILFGIGTAITVAVVPALATAAATFATVAAPIAAVVAAGALLYEAWQTDFGGMRTSITEWWDQTAYPALQTAADWLKEKIPAAIQAASQFWSTTLKPAVIDFIGYLRSDVFPALSTAAGWLKDKIPEAVQATADFWNNTLKPALATVKDFLTSDVFPAFSTTADWLKDKIPTAAKNVSDFWDGTLQPALKKVVDYLQGSVFPALSDLASKYLKEAQTATTDFSSAWTNSLYPALQKTGSFIKDTLVPAYLAPLNVMVAVAQKEIEALAGFWQRVLQPALQGVGSYMNGSLTPFFRDFWNELVRQVSPAIEAVTGWFGKADKGVQGVGTSLQDVIGTINTFAEKIRNIELPWWLTPGSPTPLENGIRGIADALKGGMTPGLTAMQQGLKDIGDAFNETDLIDQLTELGQDVMEGFGVGLQRGVRGVIRIIDSGADTVEGAFHSAYDSWSPARRFIPIGESIQQGLMVGMENMIPGLINLINATATAMIDAATKNKDAVSTAVNEMADELISQAKDISGQIQDAISDSFGATASIDRQLAKNLDMVSKITNDFYKQYAQGALDQAEITARQFADPTQGAKFFKMRSDQIMEYVGAQQKLLDLQKQVDQANAIQANPESTQAQQDAAIAQRRAAMAQIDVLKQQLELYNAAHQAEIDSFMASSAAHTSPAQELGDAIRAIFGGDSDLAKKLPGITDSPFVKSLYALLDQLLQPAPNPWANPSTWIPESTYATPVASPAQQGMAAANTIYNGQVGNTFNMPIYTNNSPAALQQSWAVMTSMLP